MQVIKMNKTERYEKALKLIKSNYPVGKSEFVPMEILREIQFIINKALEVKSKND